MELSYEIMDFIKELVNFNYEEDEIISEFKELKDKYGPYASSINFYLNNLNKSIHPDCPNFTNHLIIDYDKIKSVFGGIPDYLGFMNKYTIHYLSEECYIEMKQIICINGYYIVSEKYIQNLEVRNFNEISNNELNKTISLSKSNVNYVFGFYASIEDEYYINSVIKDNYFNGLLRLRVYMIIKNNFNYVMHETTYYNNYNYYNISTVLKFLGGNYYIISLELLEGVDVLMDFKIRKSEDYKCFNEESILFDFNDNNEVWISYCLKSPSTIGATFFRFSALSTTDNVDTIIEVYDSKFRLVAVDDDGYFDEDANDPLLGCKTEYIPIYVNNNYYIRIRHRGNADGIDIRFTPIIGNVWFYNGDIYM